MLNNLPEFHVYNTVMAIMAVISAMISIQYYKATSHCLIDWYIKQQ